MIIAGLASMPDRLPYLEASVLAIRPQVDLLKVYLNGFSKFPTFLSKEEGILSDDADGDLGAEGKFDWLNGHGDKFSNYASVDDDLGYPSNYISTLLREFEMRSSRAIVGVHASRFSFPIKDFVTSREARFRFYEELAEPQSVHMLGTATTLIGRETLRLSLKDFPTGNTSDLQLAIAEQNQSIPMVAIPRTAGWITELRPWHAEGFSIWKATKMDGQSSAKTALAQTAVAKWVTFEDPISRHTRL